MRETEQGPAELTAEVTPSLSVLFDILSSSCRRYALYYLYDQADGVATVDELTDAIATFQNTVTAQSSGENTSEAANSSDFESEREEQRQRIRMELQHTHLPKLADIGILEYDQRSDTVRYWTQPSLEEWLEHAKHKEQL